MWQASLALPCPSEAVTGSGPGAGVGVLLHHVEVWCWPGGHAVLCCKSCYRAAPLQGELQHPEKKQKVGALCRRPCLTKRSCARCPISPALWCTESRPRIGVPTPYTSILPCALQAANTSMPQPDLTSAVRLLASARDAVLALLMRPAPEGLLLRSAASLLPLPAQLSWVGTRLALGVLAWDFGGEHLAAATLRFLLFFGLATPWWALPLGELRYLLYGGYSLCACSALAPVLVGNSAQMALVAAAGGAPPGRSAQQGPAGQLNPSACCSVRRRWDISFPLRMYKCLELDDEIRLGSGLQCYLLLGRLPPVRPQGNSDIISQPSRRCLLAVLPVLIPAALPVVRWSSMAACYVREKSRCN